MSLGVDDQPFKTDEWSACLKVLEALVQRPDAAPDRERLERLIARLYRKTRRGRRKIDADIRRQEDRALVERTGRVRAAPVPDRPPVESDEGSPGGALLKSKSRRCYICNERYRELHSHYHLLCPACARLNEEKRHQRSDLSGRRAVVTGGRIKIGYQVALKLLRDGAQVLVTTRFARDAALRYAGESDFDIWKGRLRIERLDFRSIPAVLAFTDRLQSEQPALEILINNAAQTVRRTPENTAEAEALERMDLDALPVNLAPILGVEALPGSLHGLSARAGTSGTIAVPSELRVEPADHREANSWTAQLADVEPVELLEVLLINANAPFLLIGRLKPMLLRSPFPDRYIVNVAGLDGQFGRGFKTDRHPHVNISKAALNMITRTSAADYARDGIYMNSVDAGWITHEGAYSTRVRMRAKGFVPPLDDQDGAAGSTTRSSGAWPATGSSAVSSKTTGPQSGEATTRKMEGE